MIFLIVAIIALVTAWFVSHNDLDILEPTAVEVVRWLIVLGAWFLMGGLLNLVALILVSQIFYTPTLNYFNKEDLWFIDNDTWLGQQTIKYLGEGSGQVLFWVEVGAAIILILF